MNRYSKALRLIVRVLHNKKEVLLATMYIMGMTILMSAVFMYYAEHKEQPEAFSSITATLWWAVATLISITGIGVVALPTGIISSGFIEALSGFYVAWKRLRLYKGVLF